MWYLLLVLQLVLLMWVLLNQDWHLFMPPSFISWGGHLEFALVCRNEQEDTCWSLRTIDNSKFYSLKYCWLVGYFFNKRRIFQSVKSSHLSIVIKEGIWSTDHLPWCELYCLFIATKCSVAQCVFHRMLYLFLFVLKM